MKRHVKLFSFWQAYRSSRQAYRSSRRAFDELAITIFFSHLIGWRNYLIGIFGTMLARSKLAASSRRAWCELATSLWRAYGELAASPDWLKLITWFAFLEPASLSQACHKLELQAWCKLELQTCRKLEHFSVRVCGSSLIIDLLKCI